MKLLINNYLLAILGSDTETPMPQPGDGHPTDTICAFILEILWPRTEDQWGAFSEFRSALIRIAKEKNRRIHIPQVIKSNPHNDPSIRIRFSEDHPLGYKKTDFLSSIKVPEIDITEIPIDILS